MLKVSQITKRYRKKTVLENIDFTLQSGDIVGLVGENGAGKSTLLKILATLEKPTVGTVTLHDKSYIKDRREIRKQIGFVPQDIAIWEEFTVAENMRYFEKLSWKNKTDTQLQKICTDMNLFEWNTPVKVLSGGMKRKLNMAISFIHDPSLLLLDEPTVGIDLKSKKEINQYLLHQAKHLGKMIIYTSHDMDEIVHLCDRVICIGKDPFYVELLKEIKKEIIVF
ncbi:ABC transporter ATP-binding protein [Virgibacillus soli]|uniref:ATP-binding cassette domain-containing protein n=1 Tax=Paracerasibacillus soli TaxID=480284 RepID=A0ABU5CS19_9BACI|nr:ATP-binding cassette domain-containing protein [Virgibacillus soli]MDY0408627.1 ATP-binding cassette domain-containing protein [Virgibacillus soli]